MRCVVRQTETQVDSDAAVLAPALGDEDVPPHIAPPRQHQHVDVADREVGRIQRHAARVDDRAGEVSNHAGQAWARSGKGDVVVSVGRAPARLDATDPQIAHPAQSSLGSDKERTWSPPSFCSLIDTIAIAFLPAWRSGRAWNAR